MTRIHGTKVEQLNNWARLLQLGGIIGWRSKLLQDLAAHTSRGLLLLDHGAVAEVTLGKKNHLVIPHQDLVAADIVEPALHQSLDASLILVGSGTSRGKRWWHSRHDGFGVCGYEVLSELDEFGV